MNVLTMVSSMSQPALMEISVKGQEFFKASLTPNINKDKKNAILQELLNGLSEETFNEFAPIIVMQGKYGYEKYGSIEIETNAIVEKFPRLKIFEPMISERVKEERTKANLPL